MEQTKPRARTVFEKVRGKQEVREQAAQPQAVPVSPRSVEKSQAVELSELTVAAATREAQRFAALTGVIGTHLLTGLGMSPVLMVLLKVIVGIFSLAFGWAVTFTWLQAALLSGGLGIAGPVAFFLYRYWSGKY